MIWWLPDYEIGTPPIPDATDIRRMAVDAVRDGLAPDFVARLFGLDREELQTLLAAAPAASKYTIEPIDEAAEPDDDADSDDMSGAVEGAAEPRDAAEPDDDAEPDDAGEDRVHADQ